MEIMRIKIGATQHSHMPEKLHNVITFSRDWTENELSQKETEGEEGAKRRPDRV
jgi:hypothetical protein